MSAEVVWKALDYLRERGMCKRQFEDSEGHVCARGALSLAKTDGQSAWMWDLLPSGEDGEIEEHLYETARELFPEHQGFPYGEPINIADFTNGPECTKEDLEVVFYKTAMRLDESFT